MTFPFNLSFATMNVAAPFVGSFAANAVIRSLEGKSFLWGRSCCDSCGRQLALCDLVPLLSWFFQGGQCRICSAPIPVLYPALEAGFLAVALCSTEPNLGPWPISGLLLGWALLLLIAFDLIAFILPNALTLSLGFYGLLLAASVGYDEIGRSGLGLVVGGTSLLLVRRLYQQYRSREGLGLGDVKLFAAAGAWVKLEGLPSVLLIGSSLGLLYALFTIRSSLTARAFQKVPLGAGLCVGFWLTWVYGPLFDWSFDAVFRFGSGS